MAYQTGEISAVHCYCESSVDESNMFFCNVCKKYFHSTCLKSMKPSDLVGDIYFKFICAKCSSDGIESFERIKLQWTTVLMLTLYNLQLQGGGKCGYFRWREHICKFIDKNWSIFFGSDKKKSATWHGTVAGCLSNGANRYFISGNEVLGENGWWTLKSSALPSLEEVETTVTSMKPTRKRKSEDFAPIVEGSRRRNSNILEAALSLKEKKACIVDPMQTKHRKKQDITKTVFPPNHKIKLIVPNVESFQNNTSSTSKIIPKIIIKTERSHSPSTVEEFPSEWMKGNSDIDLNSNNFSNMFESSNLLSSSDNFNLLVEDMFSEVSNDKFSTKCSPPIYENEDSNSIINSKKMQHIDTSRKKKAVTKDESPIKETVISEPKYILMSPYEEEQLLIKLENYPTAMKLRPEIRRLYRKLAIRKLKREVKLPLFDIDAEVRAIRGMDPPDYYKKNKEIKIDINLQHNRILNRFQVNNCSISRSSQQYCSFITRLMGLEDEQHDCIISPYTERILKPFIFRDYTSKPLKLQLLTEIISAVNKNNPDFTPPKQSPIDYCYVRPQHIPAINALCQEFFWPGIDLSETLQYPDFSCVALYRKVIIGFAFMVPDVKYNEAYITFVFCHPEWRRAGIATFMLYHLIQTCMGKDVTLHVSATNPAIFLYQKFGFKVEEFIHDFYDKYLPPESKECRHALFLRLSR